jgi:hypothetical protein
MFLHYLISLKSPKQTSHTLAVFDRGKNLLVFNYNQSVAPDGPSRTQ